MADVTIDTVTDALRDAVYIGIGAGVLAFQKLQVQRVELTKALTTQINDAQTTAKGSVDTVSELVESRVKELEERLQTLETRLEAILADIEEKLPEQAKELVKQARGLVGRAA